MSWTQDQILSIYLLSFFVFPPFTFQMKTCKLKCSPWLSDHLLLLHLYLAEALDDVVWVCILMRRKDKECPSLSGNVLFLFTRYHCHHYATCGYSVSFIYRFNWCTGCYVFVSSCFGNAKLNPAPFSRYSLSWNTYSASLLKRKGFKLGFYRIRFQ